MAEFKMNRNGSGYYDETAYNGLNGMVKEGEVWTCTTNLNSTQKEFLIIKNHGTFCTALLMVDEPTSDRIKVDSGIGFQRWTDPRLVQYIYNSNMCRRIALIPEETFEAIKGEIYLALQMNDLDELKEAEDDLPIEFEPAISDMVALFGSNVVKGFLKCGVYLNKVSGNEILAGEYMSKLLELEGDLGE